MTFTAADEARFAPAKKRLLEQFGSDPNVSGVGLGYRIRNGVPDLREQVLTVFVEKKRHEALIAPSRRLPGSVAADDGGTEVPVDIVEAGPFLAFLDSTVADGSAIIDQSSSPPITSAVHPVTGRQRPVLQGLGIGNATNGGGGTLGCFVIDQTDSKICLLTASHVIAEDNLGRPGQDWIVQPAPVDGGSLADDRIATLKRYVKIDTDNDVDAGIAQLTDQTTGYRIHFASDGSRYQVADISDNHPAVGMVVAGDWQGNSLLTRMDTTFARLNVQPILPSYVPGGPGGVAAPQYGQKIEKVGRSSGYTSSKIQNIGLDVKVNTQGPLGTVWYHNVIYSSFFSLPGDSGAVACLGGNGNVLVQSTMPITCQVLSSVGDYYNIALTQDNDLADSARDGFMSLSTTGRLLITTTYVNSAVVRSRLAGLEGSPAEKASAQQFYNKYHPVLVNVLGNPDSTVVLTLQDYYNVGTMLAGLQATVLKLPETLAAWKLMDVLRDAVGLNRRQMVGFMNSSSTYNRVYNALAAVPSIDLTGPVKTYPK